MNIELLNTSFHFMIVKKKKASHFNEVVKQLFNSYRIGQSEAGEKHIIRWRCGVIRQNDHSLNSIQNGFAIQVVDLMVTIARLRYNNLTFQLRHEIKYYFYQK